MFKVTPVCKFFKNAVCYSISTSSVYKYFNQNMHVYNKTMILSVTFYICEYTFSSKKTIKTKSYGIFNILYLQIKY